MDKVFADGLYYNEPSVKAPDFVVGSLTVIPNKFIPFLQSQPGDQVKLIIKLSKAGKPYIEVDNWKPEKKNEGTNEGVSDVVIDDNSELPF